MSAADFARPGVTAEKLRNVDYRAGYLESSLDTATKTLRAVRGQLPGKVAGTLLDVIDREIAAHEEILKLCKEAHQ